MDRPIFFCHIPKTAGTAIRMSLESAFGSDQVMPSSKMILANGGVYPRPQALLAALQSSRDNIRLIRGHYHISLANLLQEPFVMTVLRDPVTRTISNIKHVIARSAVGKDDVRAALMNGHLPRGVQDNLMTRMLGGDGVPLQGKNVDREYVAYMTSAEVSDRLGSALANLNRIHLIGFAEKMDEINRLLHQIGAPPAKRMNGAALEMEFSPSEISVIREHNQLDIKLYRHAVELKRPN